MHICIYKVELYWCLSELWHCLILLGVLEVFWFYAILIIFVDYYYYILANLFWEVFCEAYIFIYLFIYLMFENNLSNLSKTFSSWAVLMPRPQCRTPWHFFRTHNLLGKEYPLYISHFPGDVVMSCRGALSVLVGAVHGLLVSAASEFVASWPDGDWGPSKAGYFSS